MFEHFDKLRINSRREVLKAKMMESNKNIKSRVCLVLVRITKDLPS